MMTVRRVDQRVLGAGTTVRFGLLLALLVAASANGVSYFLSQIADPNSNTYGCYLASGWDPNDGFLAELVRSFSTNATTPALEACLEHYAPSAPWWGPTLGIVPLLVVAGAFFWGIPASKGRRSQVVPLRDADVRGDLAPALEQLVQTAELDRAPRFVINPGRVTTNAVVFGRPGRPTVCLDGGLVARRQADPSGFRAVVLHELAHIRNRDVTITYATVALWRAFLIAVLAPQAVLLGWGLIENASTVVAPVDRPMTVYSLLLLASLTVLVYLTRADILRSREIYADLDALAWGADPGHWPDTRAKARHRFASFLELWRTHPRWDLRRQSLTDPVVLFGIRPLPAFLTGAATIILGDQVASSFSALSPGTRQLLDWLTAWLTAVPITVIIGVALWRAVAYAVLTGRCVPSGIRTGLWLGAGLAVGELVLVGAAGPQWLPNHPEVLVVHILVAAVITWWTAQAAELVIRAWRGRTLRPAMLLGLAVPWLAFTFWFGWWQTTGSQFVTGFPIEWEQLFLGSATGHSGVIATMSLVMAVLMMVQGTPFSAWVMTAMWLVPLLAWTVRPATQVPRWVRAALPDAADPPLVAKPLPSLRRPLRIALLGGTLGAVAVAAAMAYLHTRRPPAHQSDDLWLFLYQTLLTLALVVAPVAVAAATASITRQYRLLVAWAAAGVAALVAFAAALLLAATQGCLGPLNTTASSCHWRPLEAWQLFAQTLMPPVLETGIFLAAVVALLVEAVRRLAQRGRPADGAGPAGSLRARWAAKRVGIAAICFAALGLTVAGTVPPSQDLASTRDLLLEHDTTPVTPEVRRAQMLAWLKFGGGDLISHVLDTDMGNLQTVLKTPSIDPAKIGSVCTEINQTMRSANAYFPLPDPALQKDWSIVISELTQNCGDFQRAVLQMNDDLFQTALTEFVNLVQLIDSLLEKIELEMGA